MNATIQSARVRLHVESLEQRSLPSSTSYVSALYANLLNRTASAPEVAGWVAQLKAGLPAAQVTNAFVTSPEYQSDVIRNDYQVLLQRTPQPAEVQGWLHQLENGLGEQQLESAFLGSAEFFALHGSENVSWLKAVYQTVLGRTPETAGQAYWTGQLQNGLTLQTAALEIIMSSEAAQRRVTAAYEHLLGRTPDTGGLAYWSGLLEHGLAPAQLAAQLAASPEYINIYGGLDTFLVVPPDLPAPTGEVYPPTGFIDPGPFSNPALGFTGDTGNNPIDTGVDIGNSGSTSFDPGITGDTGFDPGDIIVDPGCGC